MSTLRPSLVSKPVVRGFLLAGLQALLAGFAFAQGGLVQQSGHLTPNYPSSWITNSVIDDAGSALNGKLEELGIRKSETPSCIDSPITGSERQLCLGPNSLNGGLLSYRTYRGRPPLSVQCDTNVATVSCGSGGIVQLPFANVMDFGAKGDGVTDDTVAFQTAINSFTPNWLGGMVFVPRGHYCIKRGPLVISRDAVTLQGVNRNASVLLACGADISMLRMLGTQDVVTRLGFWGSDNPGTSNPVISLGRECMECTIWDVFATRGSNAINIDAYEAYVAWSVLGSVYGQAVLYSRNSISSSGGQYTGGGGYLIRNKLDQGLPAGAPSSGSLRVRPWIANTSYPAGSLVSTGGYSMQAMNAGISGGAPPAIKPYGVNMVDNTIKWQLAGKWPNYYGMQFDTGTGNDLYVESNDFSAPPITTGLAVTNTFDGANPGSIWISRNTFGNNQQGGVLLLAGWGIHVFDNHFSGCLSSPCTPIAVPVGPKGFVGDLTIRGNYILNGSTGIYIGQSDRTIIEGNMVGAVTTAVLLGSGCCTIVQGNHLGSSGIWGPGNTNGVVTSPGSDYLIITDNSFVGAKNGIVDHSGGAHNIFANNVGP